MCNLALADFCFVFLFNDLFLVRDDPKTTRTTFELIAQSPIFSSGVPPDAVSLAALHSRAQRKTMALHLKCRFDAISDAKLFGTLWMWLFLRGP